jgi:hypothetical protein
VHLSGEYCIPEIRLCFDSIQVELQAIKPRIRWLSMILFAKMKRPWQEDNCSHPSIGELQNARTCISTHCYGFLVWWVVKDRDFVIMGFVIMKIIVPLDETCVLIDVYRRMDEADCCIIRDEE